MKNYRPISLTSVCSKTLERLVVGQLNSYLESNGLLSNFQYGFCGDRSVSDQLLFTYDYVSKYVDEGCEVDVVLFDYRKAFDVVNHRLLLSKLELLGVKSPLLGWLGDFLVGVLLGLFFIVMKVTWLMHIGKFLKLRLLVQHFS